MNRHTRFLVAFLLLVLVGLAAAIIVFHMNVNKETAGDSGTVHYAIDPDGNAAESYVFEDENGLYGLKDENGTVILDAEWAELESISSGCFRARLVVRSDALYGVIDNEGDVVVPFVYEEIEKQSDLLYTAKLEDEGKYFFYDPEFRLLLPEAADSFSLEGTLVHTELSGDEFTWRQGTELVLMEAAFERFARPVSFRLEISDPELISKAEWSEWRDIADMLIVFLDAYRLGETECLEEITDPSSLLQVSSVFSDDTEWKGGQLSEVYLYHIDSEDGTTVYFETELQLISGTDEETAEVTDEPYEPYKMRLAFKEDTEGKWKLYEALVLKQES